MPYLQHLTKGYFLEPTVLSNVKRNMQIWAEEVFGPVLAVSTFKTEEEAVAMANDTQYVLCPVACGGFVYVFYFQSFRHLY